MGLEKAKSLLPLKGEDTFLDFIAKQATLQPMWPRLQPRYSPLASPPLTSTTHLHYLH